MKIFRLFEFEAAPRPDFNLPSDYGGVSGGAVWRFDIDLESKPPRVAQKILFGVAFHQSDLKDGKRTITCHGPRDVYARLLEKIRERWPGESGRIRISSATSFVPICLGQAQNHRHPVSAGAERLSAYRPRQIDLPEFRRGRGIRRPLQSALRRHQSDQGVAGIYRRHRARRPLARLRLGPASLPRVRLFRAALRMGRASDPRRQGLCRRPDPGGDAAHARHVDRGRHREPLPRAERRGKSRSVSPHAGR